MAGIFIHGNREVTSVFDLLGSRENDLTYAVGFTAARNPALLRELLKHAFPAGEDENLDGAVVNLQEPRRGGGITDIEILTPTSHVIIEAKRRFEIPRRDQVEGYLPRFEQSNVPRCALIVAGDWLPAAGDTKVREYGLPLPVTYLSWRQVADMTRRCLRGGTLAERHVTFELHRYLEREVTIVDRRSNIVRVVPIGDPGDWYGIAWTSIVMERNMYFHPVGGTGYVKEPRNYMGFRWNGVLQRLSVVDRVHVTDDAREFFPELQHPGFDRPHFVYELGEPIPTPVIRSGNLRNRQVDVMIDTLLTCKSIRDAELETRSRTAAI